MAAWSEIERVRKDAASARVIAAGLLCYAIEPEALTEWEIDFLEGIRDRTYLEEISLRQSEKLFEIRDDVERVTDYKGVSIRLLIQGCMEGRLDLGEDDEEWICAIHANSQTSIRRKHLGRLLRCARQLSLLEDDMAA